MDKLVLKFANRSDAGQQLASQVSRLELERPLVFALPCGGVPVGIEVAQRLNAPLDLILVCKIGTPGNPEVALGAIVEGANAQIIINKDLINMSSADLEYLERAYADQLMELDLRKQRYNGHRYRLDPKGRNVVVVDDGTVSGAKMKAAVIALRRNGAARIVVALPVAQNQALRELAEQADDIVCLQTAKQFCGAATFFCDFHQLSDVETIGMLRQRWTQIEKSA